MDPANRYRRDNSGIGPPLTHSVACYRTKPLQKSLAYSPTEPERIKSEY